MNFPAFAPTFPLSLPSVRTCVFRSRVPFRCSSSPPTGDHQDEPASPEPRLSRRALLQACAAVGLSFAVSDVLPHGEQLDPRSPRTTDFLYESKSGSFLPPSALPTILRQKYSDRLFDRCVVAAEIHDNPFTHAAQLATLSAVLRLGDDRPLIVGFEQFYREHDPVLDAFVGGKLSMNDLLKETKWPTTWGFDPNLYIPIFAFCRENGITMRGLNVRSEITSRIASVGIQGLSPSERAILPTGMDMSNDAHFSHFRDLMDGARMSHSINSDKLARYYQVQVLWEEWMSESVAHALASDSSARMVVLVGSGHVENRYGLPDRIEKRSSERPYTILPVPVDWSLPEGTSMELPDIRKPVRDAADLVWYTRFDHSDDEQSTGVA